ncbi:class I SAM-dependent methyltransferase, partial [bacterium]|nr:class I SAM-dependent methyltransferase [bacterium]
MGRKKKNEKKKKHEVPRAEREDRHALYQQSVQDPGYETELATHYFEQRVGRRPMSLREDF